MTAICKHCGAIKPPLDNTFSRAQKIGRLRKDNAHRHGKYADAYRLGLSVASGEIDPAIDAKALGIGYRDGLNMRTYRINVQGAGAKSRNAGRIKAGRDRNKAVQS